MRLRSFIWFLFAPALLLPAGGSAQSTGASGSSTGPDGGSAGARQEILEQALRILAAEHLSELPDSALWEAAIQGMIESLGDPYAAVYTPEETAQFEEETTGNYAGIGVQITTLEDGVTITAVFRRTPAQQAGLQVGDRIVGVDGEDARAWAIDSVSTRIRGPIGTGVEVSVERDGFFEPIAFDLERAEVHIEAVEADFIGDSIAYLTIDRVARNSAYEVNQALQELAGARGLVVDLRGNPGGILEEALLMADIFLEPGEVLASLASRTPGEKGDTTRQAFAGRIPAQVPDLPMVVLVDAFSASASEIVAGALQDHDRALVIGARTFGKGVVQTVRDLPGGRKLRYTSGVWLTPLGRSLNRARDPEGRPLAEDADTLGTVTTPSGRALRTGGGVFPDLPVQQDTLTLAERELLAGAARAEVNLALQISDFAFGEAQEARDQGGLEITPQELEEFYTRLVSLGVDQELVADPEARAYLAWQARISAADRLDDIGLATTFRMERDRVLQKAVELLAASSSQQDLFGRAARGS